MKLAFNALNSGLGNNGGSRTILLCQKTLEELGHTCDIIATDDNFTWFEHKKVLPTIPGDLDALVSTACTTVISTFNAPAIRTKAWYIRAHEDWAMKESVLNKMYKMGLKNIVNSKGLQKYLKENHNVDSEVVYQGIDVNWKPLKELKPQEKTRIGCLYTKQPRKRWKDFVKLAGILGTEKYEYVGVGNAVPKDEFLTDFRANVDQYELNSLYSSCHVWFAPTESEGLHNVPMEAALSGCLIICSDAPLNGMVYDYAFHKETAMVYEAGNIEQAAQMIKYPDWRVINRMQEYIYDVIGDRKTNMKKFVEVLKS